MNAYWMPASVSYSETATTEIAVIRNEDIFEVWTFDKVSVEDFGSLVGHGSRVDEDL
jgi:hypothetical protein